MNATKNQTLPASKATATATPAAAKATPAMSKETLAPATATPAAAKETPAVATTAPAVAATAPVVTTTPATTAEPKKIDLNKPAIRDAIAKGKAIIKEGKTKADAAMVIYEALKDESKEVIAAAFVQGATLTEKGAVTYVYNCKRKSKKAAAKSA
jgi:hypothetical protein